MSRDTLNTLTGTTGTDQTEKRVTGTDSENKRALDVLSQGGTGSVIAGIQYDFIGVTFPNTITEIYTYRTGGSGGTITATVTAVYTAASKLDLLSVTRTPVLS